LAGSRSPDPAPVDAVAAATRRCLAETVPAAVPGVAFLSGGQRPRAVHRPPQRHQRHGPGTLAPHLLLRPVSRTPP
ncbi:MAG: class I fructose-bisphosphate aldolase, partial [Acidimicrobiales bacterium]